MHAATGISPLLLTEVSGSLYPSDNARRHGPLPELLAPAGSPEALRAAIAAGADAVYLGGKRFSARMSAPNFTDSEIQDAVVYAHERDVGVYVTLNTLIHDRELHGAGEYLAWLYSAGVDAVLVQDTGLAAVAREIVPSLPLHASTQMTVHNTAGVRWAADLGFRRVVLARELSLEEAEEIARETEDCNIGLEVFAHGALCYSYSGQCLLSSLIGGRSGNRGMCAQPCRKPYTLVTATTDRFGRAVGTTVVPGRDRYLLSPKDLCTVSTLPALVRSPVVSLKIEGRMKSAEYVAVVVSAYRNALDALERGEPVSASGSAGDLIRVFNRGYTRGYLFGDRKNALMGRDDPGNRGFRIGTISHYNSRTGTATVESCMEHPLDAGDGILVLDPRDPARRQGFSLNSQPRVAGRNILIRVPFPLRAGDEVYVTSSVALERRAKEIISRPDRHPVPLDLAAGVGADGTLTLEGSIRTRRGERIPVHFRSEACLVPARKKPLTREDLARQLVKTGASPFHVAAFSLDYSGEMFAPLAALNQARRTFLDRAGEALVASFLPPAGSADQACRRAAAAVPPAPLPADGCSSVPQPLLLTVYTDSEEGIAGAVDGGCDTVWFEIALPSPPERSRLMEYREALAAQAGRALAICRDARVQLVIAIPTITRNDVLRSILPVIADLSGSGVDAWMAGNPGTGAALAALLARTDLRGGAGLNVFNHRSAGALSPPFSILTLSPELSCPEIALLVASARARRLATRFALVVQGNCEVIISEDCLLPAAVRAGDAVSRFTGIRDASGRIFPVRTDRESRTHIFNSAELCLIDHLTAVSGAGISDAVIDARGRTQAYARDMARLYRQALSPGGTDGRRVRDLKAAVRDRSRGGITGGHFIPLDARGGDGYENS